MQAPIATVSSLISQYLAEVTPRKAPATRRHDHHYGEIVSDLVGDLQAATLGVPDVDRIHDQIGRKEGKQVLANRVLCFVSEICKFAERRGVRPAESNPTLAIRRFKEIQRTAFLREEHRAPFLQACRDAVASGEASYSAALLVVLMMLGGLRWSEARELQWSEVRPQAGLIRLRARGDGREANKGGDEDSIPISDDLIAVLAEAPRISKWVAPNRRTHLPYTDIRKALRRICARAGVQVNPHMLRHTFGTALAEAGESQALIGACMRHKSPNTSWRYVHVAGRPARAALQRSRGRIRGDA